MISANAETPAVGGVELLPLTARHLGPWLSARRVASFRSGQILRWVYQRGIESFDEMTDVPAGLRAELGETFRFPGLEPDVVARSRDDTRKLLFRLDARTSIESVIIPDLPRVTLCISSQAGCGMACAFCATARLGLIRNLRSDEIAGQVIAARRQLKFDEQLTNIVFMGMGEPLANYDAIVEAIEMLTAEWGLGLSTRRITVSTVGLVPAMVRLVRETAVNLAVSLSGTTDEQRAQLMPINRRYPLAELIGACRDLPLPQRRRITFEYVMLAGVNDSSDDATRLIALLRGIRSKVNLIPFNAFPDAGFEPSAPETVARFHRKLLDAGMMASVRRSRGRDVQAACGQLALAAERSGA